MKTTQLIRTLTLVSVLLFSFELFSQIDTDGTYQTATGININSSVTGTVGYKINDQTTDYDDWYKFTIPSDGKIEIVESVSSELFSGMYLYDVDGTHEFWSKYGRKGNSDTLTFKNLGAGEYYLRINSWNFSYGSYNFSVNFTPAVYLNDSEPNSLNNSANVIQINTEITGHIGFYRNNNTDYDDWYKFTIPSDGKIEIVESVSSELFSGMYLYDVDGTHEFWSKYGRKGNSDTLTFKNLGAGEYYLRINSWNYSFGAYKLKVNFYPADYSNDIEPNSLMSDNKTILINTEVTGHVGFYRNNNTDYDDWYKFTIPSDGMIEIAESVSSELFSGMYLYDVDGTHEFWSKYGRKGNSDTLTFKNLGAGEYYLRINSWNYSYGSYKLKVNFYPASLLNDYEPNEIYTKANQLLFNTESTGHVGFYSNDKVDYDDWYWFTLQSSGKIKIVENISKDLNSGIYLYNTNGTQEIHSRYGRKGIADTLIYNDILPAGNYYIRINSWNYSFGSYSLKVSNYNPSSLYGISDSKLSIYMIPDSRRLLIKGENIQDVQIFDLFGKVVNTKSPVSLTETIEIDVSNCKAGIYVVKVKQVDKVCTEKILIK